MLPGLETAPLDVLFAGGLFALLGAALPLDLPSGRSVHYVLAHATFALFLAVGPGAAWVVVAVALLGVPARALAARRTSAIPLSRRPVALAVSSAGLLAGLAVGHAVHRALGGRYPCAIDGGGALGEVVLVLAASFVTFVLVKEGLACLASRTPAPSAPPDFLERGVEVYALAVIVTTPLQLLAHTLYVVGGVGPWALAIAWSLCFNGWVRLEARQARRLRGLVTELSIRSRLAALGEISARVAHQMRHQIGLIGISLHRIEARLEGLDDDAGVVRAELANLARAQNELRNLLVGDLAPARERDAQRSWGAIVRAQLERLGPLAAERGIRIEVSLDGADGAGPREPAKLGEAWFNLVENAIAASDRVVHVSAAREGSVLVLRVEDDGPGMSDEILARATEPFFTTKPDGSGLGLAIARAAAEEEGGELLLERLPERGLRASMRFELDPRAA